MTEVKIAFKPNSGLARNVFTEQTALAVSKWSDTYKGKNLFYLYNGDIVDQQLLSSSSLVISSTEQNLNSEIPEITIDDFEYIIEGSVININTAGKLRVVFNPLSSNNALFVTDACNNYCIMCPQPPKPVMQNNIVEHLTEIVSLIRDEDAPEVLGITGGEPTVIKNELIDLIQVISKKFPNTVIQLLSNGRLFSYQDFTYEIGQVTDNMFVCIPLFGATSDIHDYIVQSKGAFDQTIAGIYECKRNNIDLELRVVLHKHTIEELDLMVEFIHRNLPFVGHIALMGMENMGFAKMNYSELWIDPFEYKDALKRAVRLLTKFGLTVSVFNLPFCIVDESIWSHCKQSISDFKTIYAERCDNCSKKEECAGLFASTNDKFLLTNPDNIKPL